MSGPDYISDSQQRVLKALLILAGNELFGIAPSELAAALGTTRSSMTRDLANLKAAGFAEPIEETGRWRLAPKVVQISLAYSSALSRAESRVGEIKNRYTREL